MHVGRTDSRQVKDRRTRQFFTERAQRDGFIAKAMPGSVRAQARQAGLCCWKCLPANNLCQR
jgi:hypothetical protein